ncbi:uncharacterized protein LOC123668538 [Melitaea cinxia]|uniref:uncharacterized protein LOC123668538 n=1 Tax=Melitaea cinxia TaxID=113334 RepID=UPI001E2719F2|nr:uncharacterized protein LOC123668538 [Melitaea cinxia]
MKVNGDIGSSYLIIEIKIPLVIKENFELDRVITLPQQHYNVEFIAPYIAFNLQKDLLLILTESDVENCVHIQTNKLLCALDKPIYELQITSGMCNLSIHNTTICKTKEAPCRVRWVKLHNNNMWLYSCCGKCTVRIFCIDTGVVLTTLTGNGLLQIGQGCTIKGDTFSIFTQNSYMSQVKVQENIPIPADYSILNSIINTSDFQLFTPEDHEDLWRGMKSQIINLKEQENASLSIHDIHQYSVLYIILGSIIVAGCLYGTMRYRRNKIIQSSAVADVSTTAVPVAADTNEDQEAPAPPSARPRFVRLDIPIKV